VPQPAEGVSLAPKLTPEDARVRWHAPAHAVDRQIRACTPAPGAWTAFGHTRLKLWPVRLPPPGEQPGAQPGTDGTPAAALAPGELWIGRRGVFVGTATRPVGLGDVQPGGKRRMTAAEWARGLHTGEAQPPGADRPALVLS
jgi:methionyl-tRNA formyltransferase